MCDKCATEDSSYMTKATPTPIGTQRPLSGRDVSSTRGLFVASSCADKGCMRPPVTCCSLILTACALAILKRFS